MTQPFRDEYSAAIDRAETLARENEELRAELARAQAAAPPAPASVDPAPPPPPPPDSLKRRTLEQLERLSEEIDEHVAATVVVAPDEPRFRVEAERDERAAPMVLGPPAGLPAGPRPLVDAERIAILTAQKEQLEARLAEALRRKRPVASLVFAALFGGAVIGYLAALVR